MAAVSTANPVLADRRYLTTECSSGTVRGGAWQAMWADDLKTPLLIIEIKYVSNLAMVPSWRLTHV